MFRKKEPPIQPELWVPTGKLRRGSATQFWDASEALLEELDFLRKTRDFCAPYFASSDRGYPGIDPAVHFKMLLIGFFENLPSERAIASRCEDSLSILQTLSPHIRVRFGC
ncbi:MAG TPA: transposase [Bacteroidota bacterium]|nr:transposase [Bacteroidota bacterium]